MDRRFRLLLAVLLSVVAVSRLLLVPGIPWEQDEALFAAAAYDTDLAQHRPHPPGFPLWIAAAKAGRTLAGDPLLALQLLSALSSTVLVLLLVLLWRPVLGDGSAMAGAALFTALPGVWFHAPRAFSTTPATTLAAGAALFWTRRGPLALLGGSVLTGAAVLVRPVLAPPLAAMLLLALWLRREPLRRVLGAVVLCGVVVAAGFAPLVVDTGGVRAFLTVCREHFQGHAGALHLAPWTVSGLGVVRASGGSLAFAALVFLAVAGVGGSRLGRRERAAWAALLAVTAAWILLAHNRTYPRYTVPLFTLLAVPAAHGVRRGIGERAGAMAAWAAVVVAGWTAWPSVVAQATGAFPPLAALETAASRGAETAFVDPGVSPFGDLLTLARQGPGRTVSRPLVASGRIPLERLSPSLASVWAAPGPRPWVQPPRLTAEAFRASPALVPLAQGRYLTAWVGLGGGVVLGSEGLPCTGEGTAATRRLRLVVAPPPRRGFLGLVVDAQEETRATLAWNGRNLVQGKLPAGRHAFALRPPRTPGGHLAEVFLTGDGPIRLHRLWVEDGRDGVGDLTIPARELVAGLDGLVWSSGLYGVERFERGREGRWSRASAVLHLPLAGTVELELVAPRPGGATVDLAVPPGAPLRIHVGPRWRTVSLPVPRDHRRMLSISVPDAFVPARITPGSQDTRKLGVVLGTVRILTSRRP